MNERRRFLKVLAGSAFVMGGGCNPPPNTTSLSTSAGSTSATTGSGGGNGGAGGAMSTSTGGNCTPNPVGQNIGTPSDFSSEGLHILPNKGIIIGRDAGGLYALSAICPHSSCDMSSTGPQGSFGVICGPSETGCTSSMAGDVMCLCHGSVFSQDGVVVRGPAALNLTALTLSLGCDGSLYVNRAKPVSNTVRLEV